MKCKILIATYFFYPEITPRAFRAYELAKEFSRQGHEVTVYAPEYDFDYSRLEKECGFTVKKVRTGLFLNKGRKKGVPSREEKSSFFSSLFFFLRKKVSLFLLHPLICGTETEYAFTLSDALVSDDERYDLMISVALPASVHFGAAMAVSRNKDLAKIKIADYGDPYYYNRMFNLLPFHRSLEKRAMDMFDYIVVPAEIAVGSYMHLKGRDRIKVIPQGYDLDSVNISTYIKNTVPTFGYAGVFYEKLRNPGPFLEYLCGIKEEFTFIVYTDTDDVNNMALLVPYAEKMGAKVVFRPLVPREECIRELSKCDFLIDMRNISDNQVPSKIIDYALTKRPVYSFSPDYFSPEIFRKFFDGDYKDALRIDICDFDIRKVVGEFLSLCQPGGSARG